MIFVNICEKYYPQVAEIYKEGIATKIATFETKVPNWQTWNLKYHSFGRIALIEKNQVLAWGSLSATSIRAVYKGVAEVCIYVKDSERGKGLGGKLLNQLIIISEQNLIWSLQASVFKENEASLAMHKKCGFRVIGYKEKIAQLNCVWQDNIILERRSKLFN